MSCGDVWKYHAILPVSTLTATMTGEQVVSLAASLRERGVRMPVPKMYSRGSGWSTLAAWLRATVTRRVEAGPGVEAGIALLHRHGVELPLQFAALGMEKDGFQEACGVERSLPVPAMT